MNEVKHGTDPFEVMQEAARSHLFVGIQDNHIYFITFPEADKLYLISILRNPTVDKIQRYADSYWQENTGVEVDRVIRQGQTFKSVDADMKVTAYLLPWVSQALRVAYVVNRIDEEKLDAQSPYGAEEAMIAARLDRIAADCVLRGYDALIANHHAITILIDAYNGMLEDESRPISWLSTQASQFLGFVSGYLSKLQTLRNLGIETDTGSAEDLRRTNDDLYAATAGMRSYTLKPAIAPSLLLRNSYEFLQEWLVGESFGKFSQKSREQKNTIDPIDYLPPTIASFVGGREFKSSKLTYSIKYSEQNRTSIKLLDGSRVWGESRPVYITKLAADGKLRSQCGLDIAVFAKRANLNNAYETVRSELLAIYSDLVVPVYYTELFDQEAKSLANAETQEAQPYSGLRRLILARTKVITIMRDDILRDLGNDIDIIPDREPRHVTQHEVVGHRRRLPYAYRAPDDIRELTRQDGIILAEFGETYVRPHKRGRLPNQDLGHKAVFEAGTVHNISTAAGRLAARYGLPEN